MQTKSRKILIVPVIIEATQFIKITGEKTKKKKPNENYLTNIPGKPSAREIQTFLIEGTIRILKWNL